MQFVLVLLLKDKQHMFFSIEKVEEATSDSDTTSDSNNIINTTLGNFLKADFPKTAPLLFQIKQGAVDRWSRRAPAVFRLRP